MRNRFFNFVASKPRQEIFCVCLCLICTDFGPIYFLFCFPFEHRLFLHRWEVNFLQLRVFLAKRIFYGLVPCLVSLRFTDGSGGPVIFWKIRNLNISLRLRRRFERHQLRCSPWRHPCLLCHSRILCSLVQNAIEYLNIIGALDENENLTVLEFQKAGAV
ncbi:uncharacterized protein [Malus domestica]|uniref:uncharacterized protein isoform X2 n=1 Tax=Malus domestica TaxID=3750 RepID=UPI0039753E61